MLIWLHGACDSVDMRAIDATGFASSDFKLRIHMCSAWGLLLLALRILLVFTSPRHPTVLGVG
jgi:hypothetical protein